jgi:RNA polymerase subunit RPABC4/transcription elongation factor Spt4
MEEKAPRSCHEVSEESQSIDAVMAFFYTIAQTPCPEVEEEDIRDRVYKLGEVWRGVIILDHRESSANETAAKETTT